MNTKSILVLRSRMNTRRKRESRTKPEVTTYKGFRPGVIPSRVSHKPSFAKRSGYCSHGWSFQTGAHWKDCPACHDAEVANVR